MVWRKGLLSKQSVVNIPTHCYCKINLNLIFSKESTAANDVGTTVDNPNIPVLQWAIKSNGNTTPFPHCVCSQQRYLKMPCDKPESRFVQRVNSCKGCWYDDFQVCTLSYPVPQNCTPNYNTNSFLTKWILKL